jgi:hypothetical protein
LYLSGGTQAQLAFRPEPVSEVVVRLSTSFDVQLVGPQSDLLIDRRMRAIGLGLFVLEHTDVPIHR